MDSIKGPGFGVYDSQYLKVTQRQTPQSIKPNVFRETEDDSVAKALRLTQDLVALSPEAKEFIDKLKKYGKDSAELHKFLKEKNIKELVYSFKELRDLVYGDDEEEETDEWGRKKKKKKPGTPAQPNEMVIQISTNLKEKKPGSGGGMWSRAQELIEKMVVYTPSEQLKRAMAKELEPFGENVIEMVKGFGTRIIIIARNEALTSVRIRGMSVVSPGERTFDGRPWEYVRGLYCTNRRIIVMGEENIGNPHHSTARHEFAHAFDHTFSEKNQRRLPLSVQLWNLFRGERTDLVSGYAGTNPQEYFAETVEAFFRSSGRDKLFQSDPKMYQYLEQLFGRQ